MKHLSLPLALVVLLSLFMSPLDFAANADPEKQIFITTKFVEVTQENTDELGFDWLLGPFNLSGSGNVFGSGGTAGQREVDASFNYSHLPRSLNQPATRGLRSGSRAIESGAIDALLREGEGTTTTTLAPGIFGVAGVFTDPQFQVVIRALNQKKGVDLMSAPSVVTRSGQRAKIEIIREFIYPTEYDPPEIPQDFGTIRFPPETNIEVAGGVANGDTYTTNTVVDTMTESRVVEQRVEKDVVVGFEPVFINNQWVDVPIKERREVVERVRQQVTTEVERLEKEGIQDQASSKLVMALNHFFTTNFGVGAQAEIIHGNLDHAFLGLLEAAYRIPIEGEKVSVAPYMTAGVGGITGGGIDEIVGQVAAGLELRARRDVGIFAEFAYNRLGNGMDFTQIMGGVRVVIGGNKTPPSFPVTPATPVAFETRNTGVTLEVDPVIGPDGFTIDLNLAPEVVEFEGFINYGSPITTGAVDALGNPITVELTENRIEHPVFSTRKMTTNVTIQDGQTVAIGGLIREDVQTVENKVPIIGDIPILGLLFKSESEYRLKRNLIIFVTAEIQDPAGQP